MNLTEKTRQALARNLPLEDALPTTMPSYVNSVAYLFGAATLASLGLLIVTGGILALFGLGWHHVSDVGRFVDALHFWSAQAFFASLAAHMATKFLMGAWRDGRWKTWVLGLLAFGFAVFAGLTGYLSQTNFDSQWAAVQAKDAMNSVGLGRFFNTMDLGQVITLHVAVLPAVIVLLVGLHLFLVRRDGPVLPIGWRKARQGEADEQAH
jgi:quinol-cytochrome oxidoreductase complex cytochrome b subunit